MRRNTALKVCCRARNYGSLIYICGIAVTPDGSVWLADMSSTPNSIQAVPRIQHVHADGSLISQFNLVSPFNEQINDMTLAPDGSVWATQGIRIQHYSATGKLLKTFGSEGSGPGQFSGPIIFASDGSVWGIGDNNRLQHFTAKGDFIAQVKMSSCPDCANVEGAVGIAFAPDNSLWVAAKQGKQLPDSNGGRVWADQLQHYAADGRFIAAIDRDNLTELLNIAVTCDGSVWVADSVVVGVENYSYKRNLRLQHLQADGSLIGQSHTAYNGWSATSVAAAMDGSLWLGGAHLNTDGSVIAWITAKGTAPQADGSLWLTDSDNHRIQHLAADGHLLAQFGSFGAGPGQFKSPSSVAIATDGSILVADSGNNRIQKFSPKILSNSPAEYDDKNGLLYLDDVVVDGTHYQATLQLQNGSYRLLTLLPALSAYNPPARFNATTNLLSIPLARAFGQDYQAQFKYLGDSLFQLQSATVK